MNSLEINAEIAALKLRADEIAKLLAPEHFAKVLKTKDKALIAAHIESDSLLEIELANIAPTIEHLTKSGKLLNALISNNAVKQSLVDNGLTEIYVRLSLDDKGTLIGETIGKRAGARITDNRTAKDADANKDKAVISGIYSRGCKVRVDGVEYSSIAKACFAHGAESGKNQASAETFLSARAKTIQYV